MSRRLAVLFICLCTSLIVFMAEPGWLEAKPAPQELVITSGTSGGTYIRLGEILARLLEESAGDEIGSVRAVESPGSIKNIDRLTNPEEDLQAHLAFVVGPALAAHPRREDVRVLMTLYTDFVQVVVSKNASIRDLSDLKGKRVYIGTDGSGTKWLSKNILDSIHLTSTDYDRVEAKSFKEAARRLRAGEADVAFFMAATPVEAVSAALGSGCCELLNLQDDDIDTIMANVPGLEAIAIPGHLYENQPSTVQTLGTSALLVGRKELPDDMVVEVLDALFDNISEFAIAHIDVEDIRLERAFNLPTSLSQAGVELHPGVTRFQEEENGRLLIATGTINGRYYQLGKRIQVVLEHNGIPARVIHTDGSIENLELLKAGGRPIIAIVQYDAALASYWSPRLYGAGNAFDLPRVKGLRRIAALHEEKMHILVRRDRIPEGMREDPTLKALKEMRMSLGPEKGATKLLARAILHHHGITPKEVSLNIPDMVERIHRGDIDGGFFMSHVPSEALKTVVHDDRNRLLSIDPRKVTRMLGPALNLSSFDPGTYRSQLEDEPPVNTVATWAVLVAREELRDVPRITEAIFEGADFMGIDGGAEAMARKLDSLPLHFGAEAYYREAGFLPSAPSVTDRLFEWLNATWRFLAILVILAAALSGFIKLKRDRTGNEIGRRVFKVSVDLGEPKSVAKLLEIRTEIQGRVRRRWWKPGELDKPRWHYLQDVINDRVMEAKENLTRALVVEIRRECEDTSLDETTRHEHHIALERRVWEFFKHGELEENQRELLLKLICEQDVK